MNLKEYITESGMMKKVFCERADISYPTIDKIIAGGDFRLSIAGKIVKASKGQITLEELLKAIKSKVSPSSRPRGGSKS